MSEPNNGIDVRRQRATRRMVERLAPWFHNLHLPDGICTAPKHFLGDYPAYKWEELDRALPADLDSWSVHRRSREVIPTTMGLAAGAA